MISSWATASESAARMDKRFPSAWVFRRSRFARSRSAARKSENSYKMMHELKQIAERVIKRANKSGASAADVMLREDDTFSVNVRMGEIETLKEAISRSLLLRVFVGKRTATSHTSDLSESLTDKLVDETVEMARLTSEDDSGGLPERSIFQSEFPDLNLLDPAWENLKPEQRINLALRTEAAALKADKAIVNSEGAAFEYARSGVTLVDDARLPAGLGSAPFDDEGVPTQMTPIIENGVLRNYLHSAYTARKLGSRPTGNGSRAGSGVVSVGPTNFYLKGGSQTPE